MNNPEEILWIELQPTQKFPEVMGEDGADLETALLNKANGGAVYTEMEFADMLGDKVKGLLEIIRM